MTKISRRQFVSTTAAFAVLSFADRVLANPLGLPLGIQLYSVRQQMLEDLDEALAAVSAAGYIEVEAASLPKRSAKEIRAALDRAGTPRQEPGSPRAPPLLQAAHAAKDAMRTIAIPCFPPFIFGPASWKSTS